ncbi:MAG: alpha-galactosidase [Acidobacteria bacterium]|nr:alpha-galactosidase [Acidobacteriota bacterium]
MKARAPRPGPAPCVLLLCLLGSAFGARAQTFVEVSREEGSFRIGNALAERHLVLTAAGRLRSSSLRRNDAAGNWARQAASLPLPSGEFRLAFREGPGLPETTLTGESAWILANEEHETREDGTASLALTLDSQEAGIRVVAHYESSPESTAVRTFLEVENLGEAPITLTRVDSAHLTVASDRFLRTFWVRNFTWADTATSLTTQGSMVVPGRRQSFLTGAGGNGAAWFALRSMRTGEGLFGGWEWSGTGEIAFEPGTDSVTLSIGLAPASFAHELEPGRRFTTPTAFVGVFQGTFEAAAAATRALVEARYAPPVPSGSFPPVMFNTWGYELGIDANLVSSLIDSAATFGVETFVVDAGWMARIGDWTGKPETFPDGLRPLSDKAHKRGMKFGLWIAFGSADPASEVARIHPEWIARRNGVPIDSDFGSWALCLADPGARAWVLGELDRVVEAYGVDWLVHDFRVISPCDDPAHGHQTGDGDWASTAGYYAVLDEFRRRHPEVILENCWNGGLLLDFGMIKRHDTSVLNDRCDAKGNRQATYAASYFLPPRYLAKYIGDEDVPPAYRFQSTLSGGGPLIFMGRPTQWDDETKGAARLASTLARRHRGVLREGSTTRLTGPPKETSCDSVLTYDPVSGDGIAFAFCPANSRGGTLVVKPKGLDAGSRYLALVSYGNGTADVQNTLGKDLEETGFEITLVGGSSNAFVILSRDDRQTKR